MFVMLMVFSMMNGPLQPDEVERIGSLRRIDQAVVVGVWGTVFDSTVEQLEEQIGQTVAGIDVPYLALHGDDPGADYVAWLAQQIPTSTVEVWSDHGHYPHLVDQARFVTKVEAFIATL